MRRGTDRHYFPRGKTQLVAEALARHAAKLPRLVDRFLGGNRDPVVAIRALFDTAADEFEHAGANKGCAIGAVALDLASTDAEIKHLCACAFDDWATALAPLLPFSDERRRRSFAVMIVAALEGAFVLSRAAGDGQAFREAGTWLSAMVSVDATQAARRPGRRNRTSKAR